MGTFDGIAPVSGVLSQGVGGYATARGVRGASYFSLVDISMRRPQDGSTGLEDQAWIIADPRERKPTVQCTAAQLTTLSASRARDSLHGSISTNSLSARRNQPGIECLGQLIYTSRLESARGIEHRQGANSAEMHDRSAATIDCNQMDAGNPLVRRRAVDE